MDNRTKTFYFILAGACGGLAEVAWIAAYSLFSELQAAAVGRAVSATLWPAGAELAIAPYLGLLIHMALSVLLALGFGTLIWPWVRALGAGLGTMTAALLSLAVVWKINFFVLLPWWNPAFVDLLPLGVSLVSKLAFGFSMGMVFVLYHHRRRRPS